MSYQTENFVYKHKQKTKKTLEKEISVANQDDLSSIARFLGLGGR